MAEADHAKFTGAGEQRGGGIGCSSVTCCQAAADCRLLSSLLNLEDTYGMLNEAKDQVAYGSWPRWVKSNFDLSYSTARRYMLLARRAETGEATLTGTGQTVEEALGHRPRRERHAVWGNIRDAAERVNVTQLADARQSRMLSPPPTTI